MIERFPEVGTHTIQLIDKNRWRIERRQQLQQQFDSVQREPEQRDHSWKSAE